MFSSSYRLNILKSAIFPIQKHINIISIFVSKHYNAIERLSDEHRRKTFTSIAVKTTSYLPVATAVPGATPDRIRADRLRDLVGEEVEQLIQVHVVHAAALHQ